MTPLHLELPQLCPDERSWRIDWFGHVGYPGAVKRFRQPYISTTISPAGNSFNATEQRDVWLPLGALSVLEVGQVWQNAKQLEHEPEETAAFKLNIGHEHCKLVKAGLEFNGEFLLPFEHHPWHRRHTNSYCMVCKVGPDQQLLIPCMELIRFYFGESSNVLHKLFTHMFKEDLFIRSSRLNGETGHLHLKLAPGIPGNAASLLGRIALSSVAQHAAGQIFASCAKAASSNQPAYPNTHFPFEGKTELTASGVWVPNQHGDKGQFVVTALRSCIHKFPFGSLSYETASKAKGASTQKDRNGDISKTAVKGSAPRRTIVSDEDPGATKRPRQAFTEHQVKFPDLARKRVWLNRIETEPTPEIILTGINTQPESVSFGIPEGTGNTRALEVAMSGLKAIGSGEMPDLPKFAEIGIRHYRRQLDMDHLFEFRPMINAGSGECAFQLPMLVDKDGAIDEVTLFTEPDGTHRQRKACLFGIFERGKQLRWIGVIEGRSVSHYPLVRPVGGEDINCLIELLMEKD